MRVVFYLQFDYTSVGKRIQHYRTSLNKTQEELAEQADISKNYLSKLENAQACGRLDKVSLKRWVSLLICLLTTHLIVHPETTTSFQTNFYRLFLHFPLSNVKC